jgi:hypothetical protein
VWPEDGRPLPGGKKMDDALASIARELAGLAKASLATNPASVEAIQRLIPQFASTPGSLI